MAVEIASFNTRGLGNDLKRRSVFTWLKEKRSQTICLQETHGIIENEKHWREDWGSGRFIFSHGTSTARGVAIIFNDDAVEIVKTIKDDSGRYIIANIALEYTVCPSEYLCTK